MTTDTQARLPVTGGYRFPPLSVHARAHARDGAYMSKPGNRVVTGNRPVPSTNVTVLKHCRCIDCRNFSRLAGEYHCTEYIGGTKVVWATGRRYCDPPPDEWHYCAFYNGPQVSKDVWVWPKATHQAAQVGAGSNIPAEPANPTTSANGRDVAERGANPKHRQLLHDSQMVPSPRFIAEDRGGNSREDSFCLLRART